LFNFPAEGKVKTLDRGRPIEQLFVILAHVVVRADFDPKRDSGSSNFRRSMLVQRLGASDNCFPIFALTHFAFRLDRHVFSAGNEARPATPVKRRFFPTGHIFIFTWKLGLGGPFHNRCNPFGRDFLNRPGCAPEPQRGTPTARPTFFPATSP